MIIIVIYILFIIIYGLFKKVNTYQSFVTGVENNLKPTISLLPTIMALIFGVNVLVNSGLIEILESIFSFKRIIPELIIQPLLRPISNSSAMMVMLKIFDKYGADSVYGKVSSVIQGCSDTTIYIIVIYFSSIKMQKNKYALKAGLLTDLITFLMTFIMCFLIIKIK